MAALLPQHRLLDPTPDVAQAGVGLVDGGEELGGQFGEFVLVDSPECDDIRLRCVQDIAFRGVGPDHV